LKPGFGWIPLMSSNVSIRQRLKIEKLMDRDREVRKCQAGRLAEGDTSPAEDSAQIIKMVID
jgi:hypothetical protein